MSIVPYTGRVQYHNCYNNCLSNNCKRRERVKKNIVNLTFKGAKGGVEQQLTTYLEYKTMKFARSYTSRVIAFQLV